jgi:tRNA modification GTPase
MSGLPGADTIAAISTSLGEAALAVVRMSGPHAFEIADTTFFPLGKSGLLPSASASHTVHYGEIRETDRTIDEVMLAVFRAPRTFTREHMVEITCHGGVLPTKKVLDTLLAHGARIAEPGEFSKRAFLNGRIDLTQAEAIVDLIHARTESSLNAANEQLAGKLSRRIGELRDVLIETLAHIEAHIDFPDEDIAPDTRQQLIGRLEGGANFMDELLRTATEGRILRNGIRAVIVGRPNSGKSSLLNQLLGHDRAIVSPIPGTTRDTIEETANIRGIPVIFIDTAGLRETVDQIEMEGIRRSRESLARAELVLHIIDASEEIHPDDQKFLNETPAARRIVVCNKTDLPQKLTRAAITGNTAADVSCVNGNGIEALKDQIRDKVWTANVQPEMVEVMINSRHQAALQRARASLSHTIEAMKSERSLELVAMDLRMAANAVGEIVGKTTTEDLLDAIFSQFCIGK